MPEWYDVKKQLQTKVSALFYNHGVRVSSHPVAFISCVIVIVIFLR